MVAQPGIRTVSDETQQHNLVINIGFYALIAFVFFFLSRILDISFWYLRIPMFLGLIYLGAAVLSARFTAFLQFTPCKAMAGFFVWMVISFPFGVWPGGSVDTITLTLRGMLMMVGTVALVTTVDRTMQFMHAIGYAALTAALVSFKMGVAVTGRLALEQGTLADPNTFALLLLFGLPFIWLRASNSQNMFVKAAMYASTIAVLVATLRTGSRSGLVTIAAMTVVVFFRIPMKAKAVMVAIGFMALLILPFTLSDYVKTRYTTLFETDDRSMQSAADSSKARSHLFWRSVSLTFQNPLLGVGPGLFPVAENDDARENFGIKGAWHDTHNMYTQVSSENGIPALLMYGFALFSCWMIPRRIIQRIPASATGESQKIRRAAIALEVASTAFLVGAMFLSVAYLGIPFIIVGLSVTFKLVAERVINPPAHPSEIGARRPSPVRRTLTTAPKLA